MSSTNQTAKLTSNEQSTSEVDEVYDNGYEDGNKAAWRVILGMVQDELFDKETRERTRESLLKERADTIACLHTFCREIESADNNWPDTLYLPDIIEKHLLRGLL